MSDRVNFQLLLMDNQVDKSLKSDSVSDSDTIREKEGKRIQRNLQLTLFPISFCTSFVECGFLSRFYSFQISNKPKNIKFKAFYHFTMKNYNIVVIFLTFLIFPKSIEITAFEQTREDKLPVLSFLLKSKGCEQKEVVDGRIESVRITSGDTITFICTTKSVHIWDGKIDHGKFLVSIKAVQRNSAGYFTSSISLQLREWPIQDCSITFTENYVKCYELDKNKRERAICIYLNAEEDEKSKLLTKEKEQRESFSILLRTCSHVKAEEFSQDDLEIPQRKEIPEWLWNSESNSAVCHVKSPSRIQFLAISCNHPSACNIRRSCTPKTCPFLVAAHSCGNRCSPQPMEINFFSGQLQCESNGLSTDLNFFIGFDLEMCYVKPYHRVSFCPVLDLEIPDADIFHGFPLQLSGRASKFVIIQKPEVHLILSNGQVLILSVHIVSQIKHQKKPPYFSFIINMTANSNTELIQIIGHRYDSNDPVILRRKLNIKVGLPPEVTGLPTELKLLKSDDTTVLPFNITGLPNPTFSLSFNGMVVTPNDFRFKIFVDRKGSKHLQIYTTTINDTFFGQLKISASNMFGDREFTINIKKTLRLTKRQAYRIAVAIGFLIILIHCLAFYGCWKLWRFCRRPTPTTL